MSRTLRVSFFSLLCFKNVCFGPAGPESIVFVHIFPQFLPNKDGSGILQLGQYFKKCP